MSQQRNASSNLSPNLNSSPLVEHDSGNMSYSGFGSAMLDLFNKGDESTHDMEQTFDIGDYRNYTDRSDQMLPSPQSLLPTEQLLTKDAPPPTTANTANTTANNNSQPPPTSHTPTPPMTPDPKISIQITRQSMAEKRESVDLPSPPPRANFTEMTMESIDELPAISIDRGDAQSEMSSPPLTPRLHSTFSDTEFLDAETGDISPRSQKLDVGRGESESVSVSVSRPGITVQDLILEFTKGSDGEQLRNAVLLYHHAFIRSSELLQEMRSVFYDCTQFDDQKCQITRFRIVNDLKFWMATYWMEDFEEDPEATSEVDTFEFDIQACIPVEAVRTKLIQIVKNGRAAGKKALETGSDAKNEPDYVASILYQSANPSQTDTDLTEAGITNTRDAGATLSYTASALSSSNDSSIPPQFKHQSSDNSNEAGHTADGDADGDADTEMSDEASDNDNDNDNDEDASPSTKKKKPTNAITVTPALEDHDLDDKDVDASISPALRPTLAPSKSLGARMSAIITSPKMSFDFRRGKNKKNKSFDYTNSAHLHSRPHATSQSADHISVTDGPLSTDTTDKRRGSTSQLPKGHYSHLGEEDLAVVRKFKLEEKEKLSGVDNSGPMSSKKLSKLMGLRKSETDQQIATVICRLELDEEKSGYGTLGTGNEIGILRQDSSGEDYRGPKLYESEFQSNRKKAIELSDLAHRWLYLQHYEPMFPVGFVAMELSAIELAQQLTLMNFYIFEKIKPREFFRQAWKKDEKWKTSPNVLKMIAQFNSEVTWCEVAIIHAKSPTRRAKYIAKCIAIADYCQEYRNFSTLCAIHTALSKIYITKLPIQWNKLSARHKRHYERFKDMFDWKKEKLHKMQENAASPAIPYLAKFCKKFFDIEEMQPYRKKDGSLNRFKLMLLVKRAERFTRYKQGKFDWVMKPDIQSLLLKEIKGQQSLEDKHLHMFAKQAQLQQS